MLFETKEGTKKRRRRKVARWPKTFLRLSAILSGLFQVICRANYALTTVDVNWYKRCSTCPHTCKLCKGHVCWTAQFTSSIEQERLGTVKKNNKQTKHAWQSEQICSFSMLNVQISDFLDAVIAVRASVRPSCIRKLRLIISILSEGSSPPKQTGATNANA